MNAPRFLAVTVATGVVMSLIAGGCSGQPARYIAFAGAVVGEYGVLVLLALRCRLVTHAHKRS